jgi:hypothetical protein
MKAIAACAAVVELVAHKAKARSLVAPGRSKQVQGRTKPGARSDLPDAKQIGTCEAGQACLGVAKN